MADYDESDASGTSSSSNDDDDEEEEVQQPIHKRQRTTTAATAASVPPPLEIAPTSDAATSAIQSKSSTLLLSGNKQGYKSSSSRIIVVLDQAKLETVKNRRGNYELLNCDDHRDLCKKKLKRDPKEFRPDICHQELLALFDSPLNKSGHLQIYISTSRNVLIELHPSVRIPQVF